MLTRSDSHRDMTRLLFRAKQGYEHGDKRRKVPMIMIEKKKQDAESMDNQNIWRVRRNQYSTYLLRGKMLNGARERGYSVESNLGHAHSSLIVQRPLQR